MALPDRIEMALPCKAEYVSVARLTTSGVAGRVGFDIETVEDLKVAVSEVCSRIVNAAAGAEGQYKILFEVGEDELAITFTSGMKKASSIFEQDEDGLGLAIINAFMDQVELCPEKDNVILSMTKKLGVPGNGL